MLMFSRHLFLLIVLIATSTLQAQEDDLRARWTQAKELCTNEQYQQAKPILLNVYQEMPRPLCCYFLGLAYDLTNEVDSAAYYYEACINNSRKPQLRAWENLVRLHLRQADFEKAYKIAWKAIQDYPGNEVVLDEFKQICMWAYFIKHQALPKDYLTNYTLQKEYTVQTVGEQNLILKNIRNNKNQHLHVNNRQYKGLYEIWNCRFIGEKESITIKFNLKNKDLDASLDALEANAKEVYNNKEEKLLVRLGALLALTPLPDKSLLDVLAAPEEEVRLCTCISVKSSNSKKVKKKCLKDASVIVVNNCEKLAAFQ